MSTRKDIQKQLNEGIDEIHKELKSAIDEILSDDTATKVKELKDHAEERIAVMIDGARHKLKSAKKQDKEQMLKSINNQAKSAGATVKRTVNKLNIKESVVGKAFSGFIAGLKS